jgi:REP element-mobilizing transposase RayT
LETEENEARRRFNVKTAGIRGETSRLLMDFPRSADIREAGYFRPEEEVANLAGNLPHWRQEAVTYFVTFRLADSLPQVKLEEWQREREAWLALHPKPWDHAASGDYHRLFTARIEKWLDAGYGSSVLARTDIRAIVADALRHFDGLRYGLDSWIIMPNHVHVVLTPLADYDLSAILHSWKSFTSHAIVKLLPDWRGPFWQKESFDHIVRSADHLERFRVYIAENPHGLPADKYSRSGVPPLKR